MRIDPRDWLPEGLEAEDYLLLSAVCLLPWAFGGVEMWAYRSASLLVALSASAAVWKHGASGLGLWRPSRWLLPAFLLAGWAVFQLLPMPSPLLRVLSPNADRLYREAYPGYPGGVSGDVASLFEEKALDLVPESRETPVPKEAVEEFHARAAGRWSAWRPLSLQVEATEERLFWFLALLLAFLVARKRAADPDVALVYRKALFVLFGALAVVGLVQAMTWNEKLLWIRPFRGEAHPIGPYVNPTHFAGVMELAVPWLLGSALLAFRRLRGRRWTDTGAPLVAGAAFLCGVAAVLAASRMAAVLILVSTIVLAASSARSRRSRLIVLGSCIVAAAAAIVLVMALPLGERLRSIASGAEGGVSGNSRVLTWQASLPMLSDFPLTGTGFGTFAFVFPKYLPPGEASRWNQVHNDYLEVVLNGGLVAALLLAWLVFAYWRRALRSHAGGSAPDPRSLGLLLGLASLSIHALVDFNHQIPANALLFVFAASQAVAISSREVSGSAP